MTQADARKSVRLIFMAFSVSAPSPAAPGIRGLFIRQPRKVIHAGVQRQRDAAALLKRVKPLLPLQLGVIALIDALRSSASHPICITRKNYVILTY